MGYINILLIILWKYSLLTLQKYVFIRIIEHFNSLILAAVSYSGSDWQVVRPYWPTSAYVVPN